MNGYGVVKTVIVAIVELKVPYTGCTTVTTTLYVDGVVGAVPGPVKLSIKDVNPSPPAVASGIPIVGASLVIGRLPAVTEIVVVALIGWPNRSFTVNDKPPMELLYPTVPLVIPVLVMIGAPVHRSRN